MKTYSAKTNFCRTAEQVMVLVESPELAALVAAGVGDIAAAKAEALLRIRRFAEAGAVSARALGQKDRDFLDLIILCDRIEGGER